MASSTVIKALVRKEWIQITRDPSSLITAFILPMLLLFLFGSGASLDMENIKISVVAEDGGPLATSLIQSLENSPFLNVNLVRERHRAEESLASSEIRAYVVIPREFSREYYNPNRSAQIQVIADGSEPNTAQFAQQYMRGITRVWQQQQQSIKVALPITVEQRMWYNEELKSHWFLIPGSIVIIMTVTGALLTALVVAREWERGTMESLMATPITLFEILFSKFLSYFILGIGSLIVCFLVATVIYAVPFRGSLFGLAISSFAYLIFALEMGLLISSITKNQFAASQAATVVTYLPAFILSGFIFDTDSMPPPLRFLTNFVPAKYYSTNLKTLFLVGDVWEILIPNILVMLGFSALLFIIITKKSVKRLDE